MAHYGVERPAHARDVPPIPPADKKNHWWDDDRGSRKGASTLLKWVCACDPPRNSVRTGRKDLEALCLVCGTHFALEQPASQEPADLACFRHRTTVWVSAR